MPRDRSSLMNLSLATRIFLGYAVVLVTFGAVSIFSVAELHQNQQEIRLISEGYLHLSQDAAEIEALHRGREKDTERLIEERSVETRRALVRLAQLYFPTVPERLALARERADTIRSFAPRTEDAFVRELFQRFDELQAKYRKYDALSQQLFGALIQAAPSADALRDQEATIRQLESSIGSDVRVMRAAIENRLRERVANAERRERRTGVLIIALSVLAIGVGLLVTAISARTLRPVRTLIAYVSRIGAGDYSAQLGLRGEDEISVLAREFDQLARSLKEREAQLREKQEALLRAEQLAAVGRISAQIAHEVRNPLSSIGLNVELLEEALGSARFSSDADARETKETLSSMLREIDRLTEITEQYLRMARMPRPQLSAEDVNELVSNVLSFSKEELERANVRVEKDLAANARVLVDEGQLRQVFLNLLRNSREAMAGGGTLTVKSRASNAHVELTFSDTGRGMSDEVRHRIFEPFFSTKENGTGLGLAVSRQIISAHGGSIDCESAPGRGTTFVIRLPAAAEQAWSSEASASEPPHHN